MRTITARGHIDLPTTTTYQPPKPKRTGLDWGPPVNPAVWERAAGIVLCIWKGCDRPATTDTHCARHKSAIEAHARRAQADRDHPPCPTCGGPVTRHNWEPYAQHAERTHCSVACANRRARDGKKETH